MKETIFLYFCITPNQYIKIVMKKLILLLTALLPLLSFAQDIDTDDNCFVQYMKLFEKRGGYDVVDGMYDNAILSIRNGTKCDCYVAKVKIENKLIKAIHVKFSDGSYDLFDPQYKYKEDWTVVAGKSRTRVTVDERLIDVFLPNFLKPKKKDYEKAPLPNLDDL